jgi:hypothetical protein
MVPSLQVAGLSTGGKMKTSIWTGTCAAIFTVATITLAAQTSSQDRPQQPPSAPQERPQAPPATPREPSQAPSAQDRSAGADKVTITGCLTPAPPSPTGTAGATESKGDAAAGAGGETKFLLTNASASAAGAASAPSAKTYRLIANETALTPHSGKKLELTGTLEEQSSSSSSGGAGSSNSSTGASASNAPRLRVESGKVLAAQCSE